MRPRLKIRNKIKRRLQKIELIKEEILELRKEYLLLSDKNMWYTEENEEVTISRRPKKTEMQLRAYVNWKEWFYDEQHPKNKRKGVLIDRKQLIRINGEWLDDIKIFSPSELNLILSILINKP